MAAFQVITEVMTMRCQEEAIEKPGTRSVVAYYQRRGRMGLYLVADTTQPSNNSSELSNWTQTTRHVLGSRPVAETEGDDYWERLLELGLHSVWKRHDITATAAPTLCRSHEIL